MERNIKKKELTCVNIALRYQEFGGGGGKRIHLKITVSDIKQKDSNLYFCGMFCICFRNTWNTCSPQRTNTWDSSRYGLEITSPRIASVTLENYLLIILWAWNLCLQSPRMFAYYLSGSWAVSKLYNAYHYEMFSFLMLQTHVFLLNTV